MPTSALVPWRQRPIPAPRHLPACRHLATALALGQRGPTTDLVEAVAAIADRLHWMQNPNYVGNAEILGFIADYAYAELVGPCGITLCGDTALGLLLIGPDKLYPPHSHPADEVYLVVAGEAEWRQGSKPWQSRPPASVIHHAPNTAHAMQTAAEPLLALYAWRSDIDIAASLV